MPPASSPVPNDAAALTALSALAGRGPRGGTGPRPSAGVRSRGSPAHVEALAAAAVHPHAGPGVAAHVVQRADRGGARRPASGRGADGARRPGEGRRGPEPADDDGDGVGVGRAGPGRRPGARRPLAPWPTCPSAPGSARWCTRCSRPPTSRRRTCAPSCSAASRPNWTATPPRRSTPTRWPTRSCPSLARRSARSPTAAAWRISRRRDRLAELDFELPLAGGDTPAADVRARRSRPAAAASPHRRRPARGLPGPARCRWRRSRCGATSPAASTPSSRLAGPPVRRRRLQDQLARPDRAGRPGAADRRALHPGAARRGDDATRTTRCRRCSTPWRCTGSCGGGCAATTRSGTSAACSTCSCAACAARTRRGRRRAVRRLLAGSRPPALVVELSDLLDGGVR